MSNDGSNMYGSINYTTRTKDQTEIDTIKWHVPDFIPLLNNKSIREFRTQKPKDTGPESPEWRFQLKMQFLGRDSDLIEIYYLSSIPVLLYSVLTLKGSCRCNGFVIKQSYRTVHPNKWQYVVTLFKGPSCCLYIKDHNLVPLSNTYLCLEFEFMVIKEDWIPEAQQSNDFENLLQVGMFSDVVMKSAENVEFRVHKAVLASRSAVLKAHFEHNTTESITNIVESPLDSEVLREVLTFIYTDKAPKVDEMPERLLAAADYYQLSRLKSLCVEALHKKLTVENAFETLQLADLHSANALKQLTMEFIKDEARLITKTESWAKVKSVDLIKRIHEYYIMAEDNEADRYLLSE